MRIYINLPPPLRKKKQTKREWSIKDRSIEMNDDSGQMGFLVDAFKGLAFEGTDKGNYLADVESIVNSYFNTTQPPQGQGDILSTTNLSGTGRTIPQESVGESPIKAALNTSTESSESLKAWGHRQHDLSAPSTPGLASMMKADRGLLLTSPILDDVPKAEDQLLTEAIQNLQDGVHYEKDFYQRTVGWQRKHHDRIQEVAKTKAMLEELECTWKPNINKSQTSSRSTGKVEDRLQRSEMLKHQRLAQQREEASALEKSGCTFQPKVNNLPGSGIQSRYMDGVSGVKSNDDTFSRLYNTGRKIKVLNPNISPSKKQQNDKAMLYTTYTPDLGPDRKSEKSRSRSRRRSSYGPKTDLASADPSEIEEMQSELREIERLLQKRTTKKHEIITVKSNYVDSDDETTYSEGSTATSGAPDFNMFLVRQNAFEERRRANLAYIEADTAPSLHPNIDIRSKKLAKKEKNMTESKAAINAKGIPQKQQRLQWLLEECMILRKDLIMVQSEVDNSLRELNIINSGMPQGHDRKLVYKQIKNDYSVLRLRHIEDADTSEDSSVPKLLPENNYLASFILEGKDISKLKFPKNEDALQSCIRELLQCRTNMSDLRIKCIKIKDSIVVEKTISEDVFNGCMPWTTQARIAHKNTAQPGGNVKTIEKSSGAPIDIRPGTPILARRQAWQGWEKGILVSVEAGIATVELENFKNPQKFPAMSVNIKPEKINKPTFSPDTKSQLLRTCITTKEVVKITIDIRKPAVPGRVLSPSGEGLWLVVLCERAADNKLYHKEETVVKASAIKCSKDVAANYTQSRLMNSYVKELGEHRIRSEDKRQQFIADRTFKQHSECTHAPHINAAPEYVSRIANSMQLLRGESRKSSDTTESWK